MPELKERNNLKYILTSFKFYDIIYNIIKKEDDVNVKILYK